MFFKSFTPLLCPPDRIRAARIYPGGDNLDRLVGEKQNREEGWFYPEAWIFSPEAAINPGSTRSDEGRTIIYDRNGKEYSWSEYIGLRGEEVLNGHSLNIIVKLLDGSCTLPKEFHFRPEDEALLREFPGLKDFCGTLIKPEVWIRHPAAGKIAGKSYIGFNKPMDAEKFNRVVGKGINAIENSMNALVIEPGTGLYIPGGTVHSLGSGLYFEILADGDLRITLEESFAGRNLSIEERLGPLYTGRGDTIEAALKFIDYRTYGAEVLEQSLCCPDLYGSVRSEIIDVPYFRAEWIHVQSGGKFKAGNSKPHVLVTAKGAGSLFAEENEILLQTQATSFHEFKLTHQCYAVVVHAAAREYIIENSGKEELIILAAYGKG